MDSNTKKILLDYAKLGVHINFAIDNLQLRLTQIDEEEYNEYIREYNQGILDNLNKLKQSGTTPAIQTLLKYSSSIEYDKQNQKAKHFKKNNKKVELKDFLNDF